LNFGFADRIVRSVREISATEASKHFADLLDAVEYRGETFTVVRARRSLGRRSAGPASIRQRGHHHRSVERLIVDIGVLVAIERGRRIDAALLPDDADIAVAAITASELLGCVELADTQRRPARTATVDAILATFDIIAFDIDIARHRAALLAHARRTGRPRGAHDLQIAATARATGRVLITTDAHAFGDLPAVDNRVILPR
jgi:tRNA(fMet)-specific endonuclease VapC